MCVSRRLGAWMVAAVVTVALVAGGILVARGGAGRGAGAVPGPPPGGAGAGGEGAVALASPMERGDARLWPRETYKLGVALPDLPDQARAWRLGSTPDAGR